MNGDRRKFYKPLLLLAAALLFYGASLAQNRLNQSREAMNLGLIAPLKNAPPVLAFTTQALGGFRGLIANILWMRLNELQQEGKYFEIVQLADWITKLQPRFEAVWVHHAWNMAYNVSVKFEDPSDRWRWVQRGIELLRDEGLHYNPQATLIYRELAWFFQHKMGDDLDDAHWHYKEQWARKLDELLGAEGGRPDYDRLLDPETDEAQARVERLRSELKLDPAHMKKVDEAYGPFDWRLPEAHAIYWAMLGLKEAREQDRMTLRRVIYQSMQTAFNRGRIIKITGTERLDLAPNLDIVENTHHAYLDMMEQEPERREHIEVGHRNFLRNAAYFLYTHNRMEEARKWFAYLKEEYPGVVDEGKSLDRFAVDRATELYGGTNRDQIMSALQGLIFRSYYQLALGDQERSSGYELLARKIYSHFQSEIQGTESAEQRIGLPAFSSIKKEVLDQVLQSEEGRFTDLMKDRLRTALGLGADTGGPEEESGPGEG